MPSHRAELPMSYIVDFATVSTVGLEATGKRAVGFTLSEGMDVPAELASRFKFATQKSKLAGIIRGSYFVIKGEY